ncbi:MAG TPA: DUF58 domain-containing protein [Thermoplasmata archaeon]|nr:DUF58 domain-containing protein [Thermoplasmata archaeon]
MRTPLASALVAVALIALLGGLALRSWPLVLLALPPLVVLALGSLDPPSRPALQVARTVSRDRLSVGVNADVHLRISNEDAAIALLECLDTLPTELAVVRGANHTILSLGAGETADLAYTVRPTLKGEFTLGPLRVRALDPLGLGVEDLVVPTTSTMIVAPGIESLARVSLGPRRTRPWFGHVPSRHIGAGSEFWGVREYVSGDDVRRINWKASARFDALYSNEYQGERSGDVVILLDARAESAVGTVTGNAVEVGVRAALGVAEHVLESKNRVGLIVQREVLDWVPPAFGRKQLYRILDHLIHVRAGGEWPFSFVAWVLSRYFPRDSLVVLISPLTDRTALDSVTSLVARGYDVTILSPSPLEIERAAFAHTPEQETAYRILRMERANLVSHLRSVAQVVDWDPATPLALPLRRMRTWPRPV